MNSNSPAPDPSPRGNEPELNEAILMKLNSYRWKSRALTTAALGVGLLSIAAGIVIAWANAMMVMPMERLLLQDYPYAPSQTETKTTPSSQMDTKSALPKPELEWRHVQVTAAHGKTLSLIAASVALLGVGTFLTLLLVIFNRHATLRQVNASLAQISNQIRQLQGGK